MAFHEGFVLKNCWKKKKKFRLYNRNSVKIPGGKIQYCPRNFTNIAEINQKIHGIRRKL